MKWVTWEHVGVDRMGCAWLICKHIDPEATFEFIPRGSPPPADAEPFDIPGVKFSHHDGHCSFYAFVRHYKLKDPVLVRIARIIDEADTVQEACVEPTAAGLDIICEGLRLISVDDHEALQQGAIIYNALYARLANETEDKL